MMVAGTYINKLLLVEIKNLSQNYQQPKQLEIDWSISKCNPILWEFLTTAMQSVRELSGCKQSATYRHTKKVRRFFIYCLLMYCIQPTFKSPIHLALTDVAEVCSGSRQLIKIMNCLGVVMSSDVHDHFVTKIAEEERQKKVWDSLNPTIFTIASADIFYLLKSRAAVFCGDQQKLSWDNYSVGATRPRLTITYF